MSSVIALSKLYALNDPRVAQTQVKGDLIIPKSDRIMTRSRAKQSALSLPPALRVAYEAYFDNSDPDQFTIIPAPLKIVKVLIEELLSASGAQNAATAAAAAEFADDDEDDGWEDLPAFQDLSSAAAKADLMLFAEGGGGSFGRQRDDETQAYLTEFFVQAARENIAGFNELYDQLTQDEKAKLTELAQQV